MPTPCCALVCSGGFGQQHRMSGIHGSNHKRGISMRFVVVVFWVEALRCSCSLGLMPAGGLPHLAKR